MELKLITVNLDDYPSAIHPYLDGAKLYDSSCSPEARVVFIEKNCGYFLKSAPKDSLQREAAITRYFNSKGLAANVIDYISNERDWLLAEKIRGDDCIAAKYLEQPERLAELLGERLALLHSLDYEDCPIQNHTELYLAKIDYGKYEKDLFPEGRWYANAKEAQEIVERYSSLLKTDTLLHGDYCLPNVILDDWQWGGFIDLDNGGVGDRHVDVFWGAWALWFNLKTDRYRDRFLDAYGRDKIDEEMLRVVAACEVFG